MRIAESCVCRAVSFDGAEALTGTASADSGIDAARSHAEHQATTMKRFAILIMTLCLAQACADDPALDSQRCPAGTTPQETVAADDTTASWCMAGDGSAHGPFVRTSEAGVVERGSYDYGARVDGWEYFHPDGQTVRLEGSYTDGVVDDGWRAFDEAGRVIARRWYRLAQPCGVWEVLIDDQIVSTTDFGSCELATRGQSAEFAPPDVVEELDCPTQTTFRRGMDDMWCEDTHGRPHGPYQRVYVSGALAEHGGFEQGRAHGLWQEFTGIGLPLRIEHFERGERVGESSEFYTSGAPLAAGSYDDDTRHGDWSLYYHSGVLEWEGPYDHGLRHGQWTGYTPRGRIANEGTYHQDVPVGTWTEYFYSPEGRQRLTGSYDGGRRHGRWEGYDEDDNLILVVTYTDGYVYGAWEEYWPNGNLKAEGRMEYELPVGLWREYYEDGSPKAEGEYSELGEKIGVWTLWDENGNQRQVNYDQ
jgi:antitoxin component YwqK of YwqJK toxin-antitoxin module